MDALQQDIDSLEAEKLELKERLRLLSKKSLLEGLSRQSSQSGIAGLLLETAGTHGPLHRPLLQCNSWGLDLICFSEGPYLRKACQLHGHFP